MNMSILDGLWKDRAHHSYRLFVFSFESSASLPSVHIFITSPAHIILASSISLFISPVISSSFYPTGIGENVTIAKVTVPTRRLQAPCIDGPSNPWYSHSHRKTFTRNGQWSKFRGSWSMNCQAMKNHLTTDQACLHVYLNERSCYEEFG